MAQRGLMRILSRKDGKSMVSNAEVSKKTKLTKVLEFVPARKPEPEQYQQSVMISVKSGGLEPRMSATG